LKTIALIIIVICIIVSMPSSPGPRLRTMVGTLYYPLLYRCIYVHMRTHMPQPHSTRHTYNLTYDFFYLYTLYTHADNVMLEKKSNFYFCPHTGGWHAHSAGMAHARPRLDPRPGHSAGATWHRPFAPAAGPVLSHSHRIYTGWLGMYHVVGGNRRQPVRRRECPDGGRTTAGHRIPSVDRPSRPHASVLRHCPVCHGRHRHREYLHLPRFGYILLV